MVKKGTAEMKERKFDCQYVVMKKGKNEDVFELAFLSESWFDAEEFAKTYREMGGFDTMIIELVNGRPILAY